MQFVCDLEGFLPSQPTWSDPSAQSSSPASSHLKSAEMHSEAAALHANSVASGHTKNKSTEESHMNCSLILLSVSNYNKDE